MSRSRGIADNYFGGGDGTNAVSVTARDGTSRIAKFITNSTSDHGFLEFYLDSDNIGTRSGWLGIGSSGHTNFSLVNEMGGHLYLNADGRLLNIGGDGAELNGSLAVGSNLFATIQGDSSGARILFGDTAHGSSHASMGTYGSAFQFQTKQANGFHFDWGSSMASLSEVFRMEPDGTAVAAGKIYCHGSNGPLERSEYMNGNDAGLRVATLGRFDHRTPNPYDHSSRGNCRFGFTSFYFNSSSTYADSFIMNSYTDASGGAVNILAVNKNGSGVMIGRQGYGSTSNFSSGTMYTLSYSSASDQRVKENVQEITGALDAVMQLRPVTFEWTDEYILEGHSKNANENITTQVEGEAPVIQIPEQKTTNVGFIAQEVEAIIPTVVHQDNIRMSTMAEGEFLKNISYEKLVPHLVAAMKEQQATIEALTARIEALEGA